MQQYRPYQPEIVDENGRTPSDDVVGGTPIDGEALVIVALIALTAFLTFILIFLFCCLKCCDGKEGRRRRLSIRSTDIRYVQQIQRLVERQKEVDKMRDSGLKVPKNEPETFKPKLNRNNSPQLLLPQRSRSASPARTRSRTSSATNPQTMEKLAKLRQELEHYKIDHKIQVRKQQKPSSSEGDGGTLLGTRKRTWGGLPDIDIDADYVDIEAAGASPQFKRIPLPNVVDVGVQTTNTLEREYPSSRKVFQTSFETTV